MTTLLAYLDPGTGSLVLQALMAGSAGFVVAGRCGWRWLQTHFHRPPALPLLAAEAAHHPVLIDALAATAPAPNSVASPTEAV